MDRRRHILRFPGVIGFFGVAGVIWIAENTLSES
jgi:hypothetical protein